MGASMCLPVSMFVFTSTVLFPSRSCVVMSVTSMDANCGHVGIRSPHGCVRSTSRVIRCVPSSVRPILLSELRDDLVRERQVDRVRERDRAVDLLEIEEALDRALDVLLRDTFVLRPGLAALEGLVGRLDDVAVGLRLADGHV